MQCHILWSIIKSHLTFPSHRKIFFVIYIYIYTNLSYHYHVSEYLLITSWLCYNYKVISIYLNLSYCLSMLLIEAYQLIESKILLYVISILLNLLYFKTNLNYIKVKLVLIRMKKWKVVFWLGRRMIMIF